MPIIQHSWPNLQTNNHMHHFFPDEKITFCRADKKDSVVFSQTFDFSDFVRGLKEFVYKNTYKLYHKRLKLPLLEAECT